MSGPCRAAGACGRSSSGSGSLPAVSAQPPSASTTRLTNLICWRISANNCAVGRVARAFDRLGEEHEALEAVALLWRVLAAMPDNAPAWLLAYLAHKRSPGQIARPDARRLEGGFRCPGSPARLRHPPLAPLPLPNCFRSFIPPCSNNFCRRPTRPRGRRRGVSAGGGPAGSPTGTRTSRSRSRGHLRADRGPTGRRSCRSVPQRRRPVAPLAGHSRGGRSCLRRDVVGWPPVTIIRIQRTGGSDKW